MKTKKYFKRYKNNLCQVDNKIFSYDTHIATIKGNTLKAEKWEIERVWGGKTEKITSSPTTSKHLNFVANELNLNLVKSI